MDYFFFSWYLKLFQLLISYLTIMKFYYVCVYTFLVLLQNPSLSLFMELLSRYQHLQLSPYYFVFSLFQSVSLCYEYTCVCTNACLQCVFMCGGQIGIRIHFSIASLHYSLRWGLSLNLDLTVSPESPQDWTRIILSPPLTEGKRRTEGEQTKMYSSIKNNK